MALRDVSALKVGFVGNLLLTIGKVAVGWAAGSQALLADGVHSFTDVLSTMVGALGAWLGASPADEDHPYGHGNAENLAGLVVSGIMFWTGWELVRAGGSRILGGADEPPGVYAAAAAIAACLTKEAMHRHARDEGLRTGSPAVRALARDHRSDALSSLAALLGIVLARHSHPMMDPVASLVIAGFVFHIAWEVFTENLDVLMDREPEGADQLKDALRLALAEDEEVARLASIRVHPVGADLHLQVDLHVPPEMTVGEGHEVAHRVEARARQLEARVASVVVHVEPAGVEGTPGRDAD